jgi:methionyl-tRNA formyltransferase
MSPRIIFMGTPDFAVASLQKLVENGCNVVAVITAPDKPSGRGQILSESPVKKYAVSKNIPVLQPEKLKNIDFLTELTNFKADLQVVVAFRMLPEIVWAMPTKGTFNLHASLLPDYRGAAPINWAIINGEKETGVTTFFIEKEIDTGKIIFNEKTAIFPEDNAGTLHDRLMEIGAGLVLKTVRAIDANDFPQIEQKEISEPKLAPKIFRETCEINWNDNSERILDFIRGLSPYPAAWTTLNGKVFKIFASKIVIIDIKLTNENYFTDRKKTLLVKCADNFLEITELQMEGKKRMGIEEFLRGNASNL